MKYSENKTWYVIEDSEYFVRFNIRPITVIAETSKTITTLGAWEKAEEETVLKITKDLRYFSTRDKAINYLFKEAKWDVESKKLDLKIACEALKGIKEEFDKL